MPKDVGELFVETLTLAGATPVHEIGGTSLNNLTSALKQVVWIFVLFSAALPAHAQQTEELQKQLQELKHQYEQTTLELQARIAAWKNRSKKSPIPRLINTTLVNCAERQ